MNHVVQMLAGFALTLPHVKFIVADGVGMVWGFSDTPKIAGNTWSGLGKSAVGALKLDEGHTSDGWNRHVWSSEASKVVEYASLKPSGRIFDWADVPEYETVRVFHNKVRNACERSIRFTYTFAQFHDLISSNKCAITGRDLEHKANSDDNSHQFSIDRLDPNIGYEPGNCIIMCGDANLAKADIDKFLNNPKLTDEQKLKLIYKVENVLRKRIKKTEAAATKSEAERQHRQEAFGAKFAILPPALR